MKKILSVFLALTLMLACICMQASAEGAPAFAAGNAEVNPGDTVEIPITIENNPGIIALSVNVSFDTNVLSLQEASKSASVFPQAGITFGGTYETNSFNILWEDGTSTETYTINGTVATLTFLVKEDAPIGDTTITVSCADSSVLDVDLNEVAFNTRNGVVSVVQAEVGGWSFAEDSTLYTFEGSSGLQFVCGLDNIYPVISDYVETTGGWTYEVELNEMGMESTGAKLVICDENGDTVEEYYAVLFGDINGDGTFDITDWSLMADAMGAIVDEAWGDYILTDEFAQSFAADCNHDLILDVTDTSMLADQLGTLADIDQSAWE